MFNSTPKVVRVRALCIVVMAFGVVGLADGASSRPPNRVIIAGGQKIVVPADGPLQHWRPLSAPTAGADFTGKFVLTGTLYYYGETPNPDVSQSGDEGSFVFHPDSASAARLPYMKDEGSPPWGFALEFGKNQEAAVLPPGLREAADKSKGGKVVAGPVSLHFNGYTLFEDGCGVNEYHFSGKAVDHIGTLHLVAPPREGNNGEDC